MTSNENVMYGNAGFEDISGFFIDKEIDKDLKSNYNRVIELEEKLFQAYCDRVLLEKELEEVGAHKEKLADRLFRIEQGLKSQ